MIYIGHFFHATNQQESDESHRRHGEFNLIVDADDETAALECFRARINDFRGISSLFEGKCRIFLSRLLKLDDLPRQEALMFNYKSIAGDPVMPFIGCANPSDVNDGCEIFSWNENAPEIEGQDGMLFMEFS